MQQPLSDDEIRRIARATAGEIAKRMLDVALIIAVTFMAVGLFPMLIVMSVNSFVPPLGQNANPPMGVFFAFTLVILAIVVVRSWSSFRRR